MSRITIIKKKIKEPAKAIPYYPKALMRSKMTLKESFSIELTRDQVNFFKAKFRCQDNWELRLTLQKIIDDIVVQQSPTSQDRDFIIDANTDY